VLFSKAIHAIWSPNFERLYKELYINVYSEIACEAMSRILALLCVATVVGSLVFLAYTALTYFDVYTLSKKVSISLRAFNVTVQGNDTVVETQFMLENPSRLGLKVTYIDQEVYQDPAFNVKLGMSYLRGVHVPPFSEGAVIMRTLLDGFSSGVSNVTLFLTVHMTAGDVPVIDIFHMTEYFVLSR
jgi:LEA14-like dessication related protein